MAGEGRKGASANCQKAARGTDFPVRSLSGVRFSLLLSVFTFCNDDLSTKLSSSTHLLTDLSNSFIQLPPTWET